MEIGQPFVKILGNGIVHVVYKSVYLRIVLHFAVATKDHFSSPHACSTNFKLTWVQSSRFNAKILKIHFDSQAFGNCNLVQTIGPRGVTVSGIAW